MKEFKGKLKFQVLKQRAPRTDGTGGDYDGDSDVIISHLIKPKLHVEYKD